MNSQDRQLSVLLVLLGGFTAAAFLLFVYGYPLLFVQIEASHHDHFERNVAEAMAAGEVERALSIARSATTARDRDPVAYTALARVLLARGDPGEALEQLAKAVSVEKEPSPSNQETRRPFYFAPARLTLGQLALNRDQPLEAVAHFELARTYADLAAPKYGEFHQVLHDTYARLGLWSRALEFGEPSAQRLDALDPPTLLRIARIREGQQDWVGVRDLAKWLSAHEAYAPNAHYLEGRAALAQEQYEAAITSLEQAAAHDHPHAAYFLGNAYQRSGRAALAVETFLRCPAGNLYRPAALAKAWALINEGRRERRQEVLSLLDAEIEALRRLSRPVLFDGYHRNVPIAVQTSPARFGADGRFPLLVVWETDDAQEGLSLTGDDEENESLCVWRGQTLLQLQWVENRVYWEGVNRLPDGATPIPGWIDTARDWFGLRTGYAAQVRHAGPDKSFLSISKLTWLYSTPAPVRNGAGYLLGGRLKPSSCEGALAWQVFDEKDNVLREGRIIVPETAGAWTWQAGYLGTPFYGNTLRVQCVAPRPPASTAFDDVMLVEIQKPDWP